MTADKSKVERRNLTFTSRTATKIWEEIPCQHNPYLAEQLYCHGYDLIELINKRSYVEVLFLLFIGELPTVIQSELLEILMIGLINPGPRHPATRATMNAGVGKTYPAHILPIGLSVLSGKHLGGAEVSNCMRFLMKNKKKPPREVASSLLENMAAPEKGDLHIVSGFGSRFGGIDPFPRQLARILANRSESCTTLKWGEAFADWLSEKNLGWLATGVAAAAFCDLGVHFRAGAGLFQLLSAPGLLAHGLEMSNKPITAMPFLDQQHFIIADEAKKR